MDSFITPKSSEYPDLLKELKKHPKGLFYKGNLALLAKGPCLAVVGSRKMTSYGRQITNKLVSALAVQGVTIVSGFMYGIDATAHKAALSVGGKTIAVMPCGLDILCPSDQEVLYENILASDGLVISEYDRGFTARKWSFIARNKVVVGLSNAVLVVEAARQSGSLVSAALAREFGREVFTVPGNITATNSKGTAYLLKTGARAVTCAQDILDFLDVSSTTSTLLTLLSAEPLTIDEILRKIHVSDSEVTQDALSTQLSELVISGVLTEKAGFYYAS